VEELDVLETLPFLAGGVLEPDGPADLPVGGPFPAVFNEFGDLEPDLAGR